MLTAFDSVRRDLEQSSDLASADTFTRQALEMITSGKVREAFDLRREPDRVRARYPKGKTWGGPWNAENLLLALRLVEAGAEVVALTLGGNWDTHGAPRAEKCYPSLRGMLPLFDRSVHALVTDPHERGLSNDVASCWLGSSRRFYRASRPVRIYFRGTRCPHVKADRIAEAAAPLRKALEQGRLADAFSLMRRKATRTCWRFAA